MSRSNDSNGGIGIDDSNSTTITTTAAAAARDNQGAMGGFSSSSSSSSSSTQQQQGLVLRELMLVADTLKNISGTLDQILELTDENKPGSVSSKQQRLQKELQKWKETHVASERGDEPS